MENNNYYRGEIRITKLFIIETKPLYNGVYKRDYTLDGSTATLNRFGALMQNKSLTHGKFANLNDIDVATAIPEIINLGTTPTRVDIANGWNEKRARFLMEVESGLGSSVVRTYLQGYTDYLDHSIYGKLDPNMLMTINSVIMTVSTIDFNGQEHISRQAFYNVIPGNNSHGTYYEEIDRYNGTKKLIRPEDIMSSMFLIDRNEGLGVTVVNVADELNSCKVSNRVNNSMSKYFNRVTSSFIDAKNMADNVDDRQEIFKKARSAAFEPDITRNPFMLALYDVTGNITSSSFTLGTLQRIDPGMRPTFFPRENDPMFNFTNNQDMAFATTEDHASTMQPLPECIKATIIANELPAYMCECMITSMTLSMTNFNNENHAIIEWANTFVSGLDPGYWFEPLLARIRTLLMPKLSDNGLTQFEAHIIADVMGEITISISLYGTEPLIFRFPCYADSLYAPIVTSQQNKEFLVNDFQNVLEMTYI